MSEPSPPPALLAEASNLRTPPERLAELGKLPNTAIRKRVATNPSAPQEALLHLLGYVPDAVTDNPCWPLLVLSDPRLAEAADRVLASKTRRVSVMRRIHEDPKLRDLLLQNPELPAELLERFAEKGPYHTLIAVARHGNCTISLLRRLVERGVDEALKRLLKHPELCRELLPGLERHPSDMIRLEVVLHPETSAAALLTLSRDTSYRIRGLVAEHPSAPPEALAEVFRGAHSERTDHLLASHPATPPGVLLALARQGYKGYALPCRLASHPAAPPELLALLEQRSPARVKAVLRARALGKPLPPMPRLPGPSAR
jgi:hypothetical protein